MDRFELFGRCAGRSLAAGFCVGLVFLCAPPSTVSSSVALTGWGTKGDVQRTRDSGFDRQLPKPVAPETLFQLLDGLDQGMPLARLIERHGCQSDRQ